MQVAAKKSDEWLVAAAWSKYEQGLAPVQMIPEYIQTTLPKMAQNFAKHFEYKLAQTFLCPD